MSHYRSKAPSYCEYESWTKPECPSWCIQPKAPCCCPPPAPRPCPCPWCPPTPPTPVKPIVHSYFTATTSPIVGLTPTSTSLQFTPQISSANITGNSPTIIFRTAGTYIVQLQIPVSVAPGTGTPSVIITPNVSSGATITPTSYTSPALVSGTNNTPLFYYTVITIPEGGATLTYNVRISGNTTGSVNLGTGQIFAYRIA